MRFPWHPQARSWRYTLSVGIIVAALICWWLTRHGGDWILRVFSLIFALLAIGLLTEQETHVDPCTRTLCREGRLFGLLRIWSRRWPLSEFNGVAVRDYEDADGQITVFVELLRESRHPLSIRYFYGRQFLEAQDAARALAKATGLTLHEQ